MLLDLNLDLDKLRRGQNATRIRDFSRIALCKKRKTNIDLIEEILSFKTKQIASKSVD